MPASRSGASDEMSQTPGPARRLVIAALVTALMQITQAAGAAADPVKAREAFVTNQTGDSLSVVDLAAEKAAPAIHIGGKPAGVAMSPDGRFAYLTSPDSKEP